MIDNKSNCRRFALVCARVHSFWPIWIWILQSKIGSDCWPAGTLRSKSRSVFTQKSLGQGYLHGDFWSAVHVVKQSRMGSINRLIRWNEQSKTSLGLGLQSRIRLQWNGMKHLIFDWRIQIQIGQKNRMQPKCKTQQMTSVTLETWRNADPARANGGSRQKTYGCWSTGTVLFIIWL